MTTTNTTTRASAVITGRKGALTRGGAAIGASVAALAAWALLTGPLDLVLRARTGSEISEVAPANIGVSAMIVALGAWGVAAIVERRAAEPRHRWYQIAITVAVVSLAGPIVSAEGTEAILGLNLIHVVTALVVIPMVAKTLPVTGALRT